jgi:hypothetical protein
MKREFPRNLAHKDLKKALFPGISRTKVLKTALVEHFKFFTEKIGENVHYFSHFLSLKKKVKNS